MLCVRISPVSSEPSARSGICVVARRLPRPAVSEEISVLVGILDEEGGVVCQPWPILL
jgi:hypothetical protein